MDENAERPARSGRETGKKERPTFPDVRSRPRIGSEGAADLIERAFPAAHRAKKAAGHLAHEIRPRYSHAKQCGRHLISARSTSHT